MHVSFEAGMGWIHLAHKNADLLLLVSMASLGLLPLVSIYIFETEKYEETALQSSSSTPEFLRSCMRGLVYLAILFPYLLALLSTYVSIQLISGHNLDENDTAFATYGGTAQDSKSRPTNRASMFWLFYPNTKILKKEDMVAEKNSTVTTPENPACWKIPYPGSSQVSPLSHDEFCSTEEGEEEDNLKKWRYVSENCAICMHPYQTGERIVWSSNPKCIHCYHYSCLQAWMEPWDARTRRCPCCRQPFLKQSDE